MNAQGAAGDTHSIPQRASEAAALGSVFSLVEWSSSQISFAVRGALWTSRQLREVEEAMGGYRPCAVCMADSTAHAYFQQKRRLHGAPQMGGLSSRAWFSLSLEAGRLGQGVGRVGS